MNGYKRPIQPADKWLALFPKSEGINETISDSALLRDTLELILDHAKRFSWQVRDFVPFMLASTVPKTLFNIWNWLFTYVQYELDDGEQVRSPARTITDRTSGVDCDCFSVFVAACLIELEKISSLKFPFYFRITEYHHQKESGFSHIYIIVPTGKGNYITVDPVLKQFDYEVPFKQKKDITMKLQSLRGVPPPDPQSVNSIDQLEMANLGGKIPVTIEQQQQLETDAAGQGLTPAQLLEQRQNAALASLAASKGMTIEEYKAWWEAEKRKAAQQAQQIQNSQQANNAQVIAKLQAELTKRGVPFPPNSTRNELLTLLRANPGPGGTADFFHAINRFNPLVAGTRSGIIAAMKINFGTVAGRLRWAYASPQHALANGITQTQYDRIKAISGRFTSFFQKAGGQPQNLMKAILTGRGNRDKLIPVPSSLKGLGNPAAAASVGVATGIIGAFAGLLKAVGELKLRKPDLRTGGQISNMNKGTASANLPAPSGTGIEITNQGTSNTPESPPPDGKAPNALVMWWKGLSGMGKVAVGIGTAGLGFGIIKGVQYVTKPKAKTKAKPKAKNKLSGPPKGPVYEKDGSLKGISME